MDYAVIETGGKQYKVTTGQTLDIEKLPVDKDGNVLFDKVLLYVSEGKAEIGTPYLSDIAIKAKMVDQIKDEKIRVAKFKAKSRYRKVMGHRQLISKVQIESIKKENKKKEWYSFN